MRSGVNDAVKSNDGDKGADLDLEKWRSGVGGEGRRVRSCLSDWVIVIVIVDGGLERDFSCIPISTPSCTCSCSASSCFFDVLCFFKYLVWGCRCTVCAWIPADDAYERSWIARE